LRAQASVGSPDAEVATTPEERQAAAVRSLVEPGERRQMLAQELAELEAGLRPAVLAAVSAGVPYRRLEELTGIPRATVARWAKADGALNA
jgi:DNA-directed RNA polymerase specialized sigma24 family protein